MYYNLEENFEVKKQWFYLCKKFGKSGPDTKAIPGLVSDFPVNLAVIKIDLCEFNAMNEKAKADLALNTTFLRD